MKEHIKNLWVEALRSEKFPQGKASLRSDDNYCCLGVLCEISGVGNWSPISTGGVVYVYASGGDSNQITLPRPVQEWAGMATNRGFFGNNFLDNLNDSGMSFPEIADVIEQNWKVL